MKPKPVSSTQPDFVPHRKEHQRSWTVRGLLEWTTGYFQESGIATARLDAEILLAHTMRKERLDLYLQYESPVPQSLLEVYREYVRRRKQWEPVAYITGTREFYSIDFEVNPSVLIPRPETEHLVEHAIRIAKDRQQGRRHAPLRILEVGTGCGNIPVALARALSDSWIVSVDISADALRTAKRNLDEPNDAYGKVRLVQGDLLEWLHPTNASFHMVVSNPPYVSAEDWNRLSSEIRNHEPKVALNAGKKGTELQERILDLAPQVLTANGTLIMEIDENQQEPLLETARHTGRYRTYDVFPDYTGKPRILLAET